MKNIFYWFFVCLYFYSHGALSQDLATEYNFVNIKEGNSKIGVSTIIQDNYGFIWLGTSGVGLNRFDGIDYVSYKHSLKDSMSISNSLIYSSFLDKQNRLWFGTEEGLNLYDRDLDQFKRIPIYNTEIKKKQIVSVRSLQADDKNNLFIGTFASGLYKLNLKTFEVKKVLDFDVNKSTSFAIYSLQCNLSGKLFAGTSIGLLEYDYKSNKLIPVISNIENSEVLNESVYSLLSDSQNNLWIGTENEGLIKYKTTGYKTSDKEVIKRIPISNNRILSMVELPEGGILVGTENDGLFHLDPKGKVLKNYVSNKTDEKSILSNSIWSLFRDSNDRIWMGYYNSGVAVYDKLFDKFKNLESITNNTNSLQTASVTGIVQDDSGKLWICMDGGGIDVYDLKTHKFTHINKSDTKTYSGLTSNYLECIFIDSKKNIWAGSWNSGIFLLKNGAKKFINYSTENTNGDLASDAILSITEDSEGTIWIGTFYKGLHSFDPNTNKITHHNSDLFKKMDITDSDVRKVLVDSKDNIWLGTTQGLFKITKNKESVLSVKSFFEKMSKEFNNGVSANHVLAIYESSDKQTIWIGTRGAGLCKYDVINDTVTWFNKLNGLSEENVTGIIESLNGNIWLSGNSGIYKYDVETAVFKNYTNNDGLLSNDFNINATFRDREGNLYFGNYKGVDFFNPNDISTNTSLPTVYLTDFKLSNKKVVPNKKDSPLTKVISETDSITLTHRQSVFTIDYSTINYTRPEKNQYAYYLEGLENSWNYVGSIRNATYTNLDYGNYIFKLKSANNDGVWNETPLELKITILPPWWKTNWAILIYVLLFFSAAYVLNKIVQSRIKEKELIRNERNQRIQEDELHEKKLQFFTNISHEFRTPLTLMINPLQDIINDDKLNLPMRVKEKHNVIYKNTDRLYRLINELMDFRKLELNKMSIRAQELNLVNFTREIISYFKEEAFYRNIHLAVDADVPTIPLWADQSMLEKIIFNILSNAMKVTPDSGAINIDLLSRDDLVILPLVSETKPNKVIEIIISDTGPGLEKDQINKIFERFYQVESLNKTYYGGTGIGLEVVQNFVQLHKGKIEVESKLGEGTTFRILLPAGKTHFVEHELFSEETSSISIKERFVSIVDSESSKEDVSKEKKNTKSHTVLIVEDNTELRNYLKDELKKDYKILVANNGKEGLEIAREVLPDAIITDVMMPEMNGFDFCRIIKTDITTSHIPLLMLTAKTRIDDRIEGIGYGADAYMIKPFDMRLLKLRVSQLITSRKLIFDKYFGAISGTEENKNTTSIDKEFIQKVLSFINENMSDSDLSVELLAAELNLSRSQLYRKIKTLTGQTVNEFLRKIRLQRAKQLLESGSANVSEVCYKVGFSSPSYFTKCFKAHFGMLPTEIESNS